MNPLEQLKDEYEELLATEDHPGRSARLDELANEIAAHGRIDQLVAENTALGGCLE